MSAFELSWADNQRYCNSSVKTIAAETTAVFLNNTGKTSNTIIASIKVI